jgi:23S rRNA (uracil1939-C5)-methyltransferase
MIGTGTHVTIRGIAGGGDGVATLADGRTVFVPRAAPGDLLELKQVRLHSRFARAEIAAVLEPGPDRVMPICPHYTMDRCGGCQLMHLAPKAQRAAKARIAGDALRRIAHLDVPDPDVVESPSEFGYRTKITFTMQKGRLGYHPVGDASYVFDVQECLIADTDVRRLHAALRTAREHLPQDAVRVVLRVDRTSGFHVIVIAESGNENAWTGGKALHKALARAGVAAVVWWQPVDGNPRAVAGADDPWPAAVFEQVHPAMGQRVRQLAVDAFGALDGMQVWDLYAGIGETTLQLVARGATVASVESDTRAVRLAESLGPNGPRRIAGFVENIARTLPSPDVVVTNPPRIGMAPRAIEALLNSGATRIAYISCDPATLARDLARLEPKYRLASVQAFDQFPQTAHMECLAVLERR